MHLDEVLLQLLEKVLRARMFEYFLSKGFGLQGLVESCTHVDVPSLLYKRFIALSQMINKSGRNYEQGNVCFSY